MNRIPVDEETIYTELMGKIQSELGEVFGEADPRRIVVGNLLQVVVASMNQANAYANAQFLDYSWGEQLDNLGDFLGVERLPPAPAQVTVTFTTQSPTGVDVVVPMGTRVTPDGKLFFATIAPIVIDWSVGTGTVDGVCLVNGSDGNGLPEGAITTIVDPVPYLIKVTNSVFTWGEIGRAHV